MQKYLVNAYLDSYDTITIEMNKDFFAGQTKSFQLVKDDKLVELRPKTIEELKNANILSPIKIKTHGKIIIEEINK